MNFIKFLVLLSVFTTSGIYCAQPEKKVEAESCAQPNQKRKAESALKQTDKTVPLYNSMINEICTLLNKKKVNNIFKFNGIFKKDELSKVIHIIIAKVNYAYKNNLPNKKHFLNAVCYTLNENYEDFFRLYKEKEFVTEFTQSYQFDNAFFQDIICNAMIPQCIELVTTIIRYEDVFNKKYYSLEKEQTDAKAALYKEQYNKEKDLMVLHGTLKRHYLNPIRKLLQHNDPNVVEFLTCYAHDDLVDKLKNDITI